MNQQVTQKKISTSVAMLHRKNAHARDGTAISARI